MALSGGDRAETDLVERRAEILAMMSSARPTTAEDLEFVRVGMAGTCSHSSVSSSSLNSSRKDLPVF